jgi:hypothetical protein
LNNKPYVKSNKATAAALFTIHYYVFIILLPNVWQKRDYTRAFDGLGKLTLVEGAGTRGSAGEDFGAFREEAAKFNCVFIIYMACLVNAELANFTAAARTQTLAVAAVVPAIAVIAVVHYMKFSL